MIDRRPAFFLGAMSLALALAVAGGCSDDDNPPTGPSDTGAGGQGGSAAGAGGDGNAGTSSPGGAGGTGGTAGAAGSGAGQGGSDAGAAGSASGAAGEGGQAGASGSGAGTAGAGGATIPPAIAGCGERVAFVTSAITFGAPTEQPVAQAFNSVFYAPTGPTLALAFKGLSNPDTAQMTLSAVIDQGGVPAFRAEPAPLSSTLAFNGGAVQNSVPLDQAFLRLPGASGDVFLELQQVRVQATIDTGCTTADVAVTAFVDKSQADVTFLVDGEATTLDTISPLAGTGGKPLSGWDLRFTFKGPSTDFVETSYP